jgi:hypothetical protein
MKRQPKPFAVEIKRSRRPQLPLASSQLDARKSATNGSEKTSLPKTFGKAPTVAELAVPAVLQSSSGAQQLITEGGGHVLSSTDARQADERKPRILPCLTTEIESAEPKRRTSAAKKVRPRKALSSAAPKESKAGHRNKSLPQDAAAKSHKMTGKHPEAMASLPFPIAFAGDATQADRPLGRPSRQLLKRGLEDAKFLPRGQRWKRRLHPRAW